MSQERGEVSDDWLGVREGRAEAAKTYRKQLVERAVNAAGSGNSTSLACDDGL